MDSVENVSREKSTKQCVEEMGFLIQFRLGLIYYLTTN